MSAMRWAPRAIAAGVGLLLLVLGIWAFASPQSFYDQLAVWPPYNQHFLHDVGSFQAGIGATLLLAVFARDALLLALSGAAVGSILHAISHVIDRDLGGRPTDPIGLGILAAVILAGARQRARELRR
jgi:hypothetical protein